MPAGTRTEQLHKRGLQLGGRHTSGYCRSMLPSAGHRAIAWYRSHTAAAKKKKSQAGQALGGPTTSTCNLCGHLQRCHMSDIEKSRKTAKKRWHSGSRSNSRKTAGETAETPEKQSKQLFFGCFGSFSGCVSAVWPGPTRHLLRLFSGCFHCRAFGTSVDGHRDCKPILVHNSRKKIP